MATFYQAFPPQSLRAAMLNGAEHTLTIRSVNKVKAKRPSGDKEDAWYMHFENRRLPLEVNKMNWKLIIAATGEKDSDAWPGKQITVAPEPDISGMSDDGLCIRVVGSPALSRRLELSLRGYQGKMERRVLRHTGDTSADISEDEASDVIDEKTGEILDSNSRVEPETVPAEPSTVDEGFEEEFEMLDEPEMETDWQKNDPRGKGKAKSGTLL